MSALMSVVVEVTRQPILTIGSCRVLLEIDLLVFHGSPESFDHHIVNRASLAIHADRNVLRLQRAGELMTRELGSLIRVEDFGFAKRRKRIVQSIHAKVDVHAVGQSPRKNIAAEPIHHGNQIQEAKLHRNVRDVATPNLVGPIDFEVAQQVRIAAC